MFTLVIAQKLGFQSNLILGFSILEGVCLTVALMLLVERHLFSTTSLVSRRRIDGPAGGAAVLAVAAEARQAAESSTQA